MLHPCWKGKKKPLSCLVGNHLHSPSSSASRDESAIAPPYGSAQPIPRPAWRPHCFRPRYGKFFPPVVLVACRTPAAPAFCIMTTFAFLLVACFGGTGFQGRRQSLFCFRIRWLGLTPTGRPEAAGSSFLGFSGVLYPLGLMAGIVSRFGALFCGSFTFGCG